MVSLIHTDKSEARCVLHRDHPQDDSAHMDEHGCHAPVLVHQATIEEAARVQAASDSPPEYQSISVRLPVGLYERLRAHARMNHRSVNGQITIAVERELLARGSTVD